MKTKTIFFIIIMLAVSRLAYAFPVPLPSCAYCDVLNPTADYHHRSDCRYYPKPSASSPGSGGRSSSGGYSGSSGGSFETQIMGSFFGALFNSVFAPPPDTSVQDEINRQNAIKQQQVAEEKKRAANAAANQAWINLQNKEALKRNNEDTQKQKKGQDLLKKTGIVSNAPLSPFKYERVKKPEQDELEQINAVWMEIQQRIMKPNKWCSAVYASLKTNAPPPPHKKFNELQAGDVLIIGDGKIITAIDNLFSGNKIADAPDSPHTVLYLKEVNGKKLFLDSQPREGPRIISEDEFLEKYGPRGADVARLVGQPLNEEEAKKLFTAAVEMAQKNRKKIANNWFGTPLLGTNWGAWGEDNLVCSDADWALINIARKEGGIQIPPSDDRIKKALGVKFSPADYRNSQYFIVTHLDIIPMPSK